MRYLYPGRAITDEDFTYAEMNAIFSYLGTTATSLGLIYSPENHEFLTDLESVDGTPINIQIKLQRLQQDLIAKINSDQHIDDVIKNILIGALLDEPFNTYQIKMRIALLKFLAFCITGTIILAADCTTSEHCDNSKKVGLASNALLMIITFCLLPLTAQQAGKFLDSACFVAWSNKFANLLNRRDNLIRLDYAANNTEGGLGTLSTNIKSLLFSKRSIQVADLNALQLSRVMSSIDALVQGSELSETDISRFERHATELIQSLNISQDTLNEDTVNNIKNTVLALKRQWIDAIVKSNHLSNLQKEKLIQVLINNPNLKFKHDIRKILWITSAILFGCGLYFMFEKLTTRENQKCNSNECDISMLTFMVTSVVNMFLAGNIHRPANIFATSRAFSAWIQDVEDKVSVSARRACSLRL